jgi:glucose-6-phosphate isomerase
MSTSWERFQKLHLRYSEPDFALDLSRMAIPDGFLDGMAGPAADAVAAMTALEQGAISNPDENRMVGHYWLRNPALAPDPALAEAIRAMQAEVETFAREVRSGVLRPPTAARFTDVLIIGIGGSALGPQLVSDALGDPAGPLRVHFLDNTDPAGFDRALARIGGRLASTLCVVISKSGGTKETRNGMVETEAKYAAAGLDFAQHAVAITGAGSELDRAAQRWLRRFPMWDWVGGRTSVMSAVGLLPAALEGIDVRAMLAGAAAMDSRTRTPDVRANAALLLALAWHWAGSGKGTRDMVILPYKDGLALFSKYLQQLVMESIGKEKDLAGRTVHQGIAVYGNKGSTDQHAYVQQLRDGLNNFFVTFVEVLEARAGASMEVEPGITSGDYLQGFLRGTRQALHENGRDSLTLTIPRLDAASLGGLIALFERAVGFYAALVGINAYHQPGVEAGKKAAGALLALQERVIAAMLRWPGLTGAEEVAAELGADVEAVYHLLVHLAANRPGWQHVRGDSPADDRFGAAA